MAVSKTNSRKGFTIAEMLMCLVILGLILTAVTFAFQASGTNYKQNREIFEAVSSARLALARMSAQLRTATAVDINEPSTQCSLISSDTESIVFRFDQSARKLFLDSDSGSHVLCENVDDLVFTRRTGLNDEGQTCVKSMEIKITVRPASTTHTLSTAVVLRKLV